MRLLVRRKRLLGLFAVTLFIGAMATVAWSQEMEVIVKRPEAAVSFPEGKTLTVKFKGTFRLPDARAEAKVERKKGMTEIEVELDGMKPASLFGSNYNTYVLWTISPEGQIDNVGEFILNGTAAKLNVSTKLAAFGMFVSAEPHYLVWVPSRVSVLVNDLPRGNPAYEVKDVTYKGRAGVYSLDRESIADQADVKGQQRTELLQARTAVRLAEESQAAKYAAQELAAAKAALDKTEKAAGVDATKVEVTEMGREAVRLAVAARKSAIKGALADAVAEAARIKKENEDLKGKLRAALSKVADTKDTDRGITVNIPDVLFDSGKATLRPEAREIISRISGIVFGIGGLNLKIEGHTDSQGGDEMNLKLSKDRANVVKDYLVDAGLSTDWITTDGLGVTKPIADNETPEGRQKNRRVEIIFAERPTE